MGHHSFVENVCLTVAKRKALQRNPSVFQKAFGNGKIYAQEGKITIFDRKFGVSHYQQTS